MNKLLKLVILIIIINQPFQVFSQTYNINTTTKKISNYSNIINFSKITKYDLDFDEYLDTQYMNTKISISINNDGFGRMVFKEEVTDKIVLGILSCEEKKYKNSNKLVWEVSCFNDFGFPSTFYFDFKNNKIDRMWIKSPIENVIFYYTN